MKTNKIVIGNFKMNMLFEDIEEYIRIIKGNINSNNVIICPTSIYISYFLKQDYKVGIQNVFNEDKGSYTGEVSSQQAKSMGIDYVIVGHSERRIYFKEEEIINKKILAIEKNNMISILCIGETIEEKLMFKTEEKLKKQIVSALNNVEKFDNIIIAYEPVWAIGTNKIPSVEDISKIAIYIKQVVNEIYEYKSIKVLYGGSVNKKNINEINKINEIDGVLVGNASTNAEEFLNIIEVVVNQ